MSKLLVVDDEEAILRVLSFSLKSDGYDVVTACDGEKALAVFKEESPDIVLTDIKMPVMDGIELLKEIKALDTEAEVIIVTGHGDIENAIEALQLGASDFINKPVKDEALSIALERALEKIELRKKLAAYTKNLEKEVQAATAEIMRKSNFMAKLITSSNEGIIATDQKSNIVLFNPGAGKISGYEKSEVMGKLKVSDILPDSINKTLEERDAQGKKGTWQRLPWTEITITSKNGTDIPVKFSGTLLHEKKNVVGSVVFLQDLREIKRLEAELVSSERLAAIGQTVAGMAHGIKNILHGFKGGKYLVDSGLSRNNTEKLEKGWDMVKRNISRTSDLVMDLLSYSKEREPEYEKCYPNEVAGEVCDFMEETAAENKVRIKRDFDPDIGEVLMDPRNVHTSLMNLMSNAVDACIFDEDISKDWEICLKTSLDEGGTVKFEVADNGAGMSEEVRDKLFASFFSTKGHRGTGLGLLVTRKLVEEHNGNIEVNSRVGKGSEFAIRLPCQTPDA
ncbi:response regulator [Desulfobacterales bacterium HSG16]|nr:response regulator [Desulfobacterales bacterium HSG16]